MQGQDKLLQTRTFTLTHAAMSVTPKSKRWWGWGDTGYELDQGLVRRARKAIRHALGISLTKKQPAVAFDALSIPESRLSCEFIDHWSPKGLSLDPFDRLCHSTGKSYRDLLRLRTGNIERYPDAVLFLAREEDLPLVFHAAEREQITLIPFGGGTGVVGGTECTGPESSPIVVINLRRLNSLLALDEESQTATFQTGILGPELEQALRGRGYTLGHFPQSFEFSTLGGWIATRSAGQNSTYYGGIDRMLVALKMVSPKGMIHTLAVPASASGPSLPEILVGSEGVYGIITQATIRIHRLPETEQFVSAFFGDFRSARNAVRTIMQDGLCPSIIRLSDSEETAMLVGTSIDSRLKRFLLSSWFAWKRLGNSPCLLILGSEGSEEEVVRTLIHCKKAIRLDGGKLIAKDLGRSWKRDRFQAPYLRDSLMDDGLLVETFETAAEWSRLEALYQAIRAVFDAREHETGEKRILGCHLSHAYRDGASLYFTIIGKQREGSVGDRIREWQEIKTLATTVIAQHGGTLSHHHGIGTDHRPWMPGEKSALGIAVLQSIKRELDPQSLLNPGKLF